MNIPNAISLMRLLLAPLIVWLIITGRTQFAFWIFVVAGISDAVDGFLAKRFGWETELGAYLDALADKLLLVCIFVALGFFGQIPAWLVIAVVSRDFLIISALILSWMLNRPMRVHPLLVSKANTVAQIVLAAITLAGSGFGLGLEELRYWLAVVAGLLTLLSAASYLQAWLRHMAGYES